MPEVETYDESSLPAHVAWQAIAYMREVWPTLFVGPMVWITRPYPPAVRPRHFLIQHDGVLIAYAAVIRLTASHEGGQYTVDGLGNVITSAPYRRQGHAGRLLDAVNAYLDGAGADVAALFCRPDLAPVYDRAGWQACTAGTIVGDPPGRPYDELRMMRFLSDRGRSARSSFITRPMRVAHTW